MKRARGLSLLETVFAFGLSMVVMLAVNVMFVDSLRFRVLNDKVVTRTLESEVLDQALVADIAEADLALSTIVIDGVTQAPAEVDGDVWPEPGPLPEGASRGLTAMALPRARNLRTNVFEIDARTTRPVYRSVRVRFQRAGESVLRSLDAARADGGDVQTPLDAPSLGALCAGQATAGEWVRINEPRVLSQSVERCRAMVLHRRLTWSDNEPVDTHAVFITIRRDDTRAAGGPSTHTTFTRFYRSWNSTFRDPGPLKSPLPVPVPPAQVDAGRNEW